MGRKGDGRPAPCDVVDACLRSLAGARWPWVSSPACGGWSEMRAPPEAAAARAEELEAPIVRALAQSFWKR